MEQIKQKVGYMKLSDQMVSEESISRSLNSLLKSGILKSILSAVVLGVVAIAVFMTKNFFYNKLGTGLLLIGIALAFGAVNNTPKRPKNSNQKNLIQW